MLRIRIAAIPRQAARTTAAVVAAIGSASGWSSRRRPSAQAGAEIASPLFQVTVGQCRKLVGKFFDDLLNRPLCDRAFIHFRNYRGIVSNPGHQNDRKYKGHNKIKYRPCHNNGYSCPDRL